MVKKISTALLLFAFGMLLNAQEWKISYLEGTASIVRDGRTIAAEFGFPLIQKDTVITAQSSVAILENTRGDTLKLRESTQLRIDTIGTNTDFRLQQGGVFARIVKLITGNFNITTPSVTAGVRGTQFFVAYGRTVEESPDVWLCVNEGTVAVNAGAQEVLVHAGEGVNILNGVRITEPREYPWTKGLNWNTDPSSGTVQDTTDLNGAYSDLLDMDYE